MFPCLVQSVAARLYWSFPFYSARRRMLSDAFDITLPPTETKPHWTLKIFISTKVIVRVKKAPVHDVSFSDEVA